MTVANPPNRRRIVAFVVFCAVCITGAVLYFFYSKWRASNSTTATSPGTYQVVPTKPGGETTSPEAKYGPQSSAPAESKVVDSSVAASRDAGSENQPPPAKSVLLFRINALGEFYGKVGQINLPASNAPVSASPLSCERLHFAAGNGVCLKAERHIMVSYSAVAFDRAFQVRHQFRLSGIPSRVKVAPNGRHAAFTVFVSGHSYADAAFSTLTTFVDLEKGEIVAEDMEKFMLTRDGEQMKAADINFWGVTFKRDGNEFYASVGTGGRIYMVEGDLAARQAKLVRPDIECPALSPDYTRVAFKKRTGGGAMSPVSWRLSVLDLRTGKEQPLAETRSVDDQVEWSGNNAVLYALPAAESGTSATNIWTVPADGSGKPRLLLPNGYSPVVLRE